MINGLASAIPFTAPAAETRVGKETRNKLRTTDATSTQLETRTKSSQTLKEPSASQATRKKAITRKMDATSAAVPPNLGEAATSKKIAISKTKDVPDGTQKRRRVRIRVAKDGTREVISMKESFVSNKRRNEVKQMRRSQAIKGRKLLL